MFARVPVSTSSVTVTSIRDGLGCIFDTTYSQRLSGLISPQEYRATMDRLNHASKSQGAWIGTLLGLGMIIGGFIMFLVTIINMGFSHGFPITIVISMVLVMTGGIGIGVGRRVVEKATFRRMTAAVIAENDMYALRGITWRLHALPITLISTRGAETTLYNYQIEIEVNTPPDPSQVAVPIANYAVPVPVPQYSEPMNAPLLPPAYQESHGHAYVYAPSQSVHGTTRPIYELASSHCTTTELSFCQQCQRKIKPDEKFCSQCGSRV